MKSDTGALFERKGLWFKTRKKSGLFSRFL